MGWNSADETSGWIFSEDAHTWMSLRRNIYTPPREFFTLKSNEASCPPGKWPIPFPEHSVARDEYRRFCRNCGYIAVPDWDEFRGNVCPACGAGVGCIDELG